MKRFKRSVTNVFFPAGITPTKAVFDLLNPSRIILENGKEIESCCLNCPDSPCMTLEIRDVSKNTRVASIASLESRVCPTDSIKFGDDGFPEVSSTCVGCGLCITRCPVHAIYFDEHKNHAQVLKTTEFYTKFYGNDQQFNEARNSLSQLFVNNSLEESILEVLGLHHVFQMPETIITGLNLQLIMTKNYLPWRLKIRLMV